MENGPPDEDRQALMWKIRAMLGGDWSFHAVQIGVDQAAQQVQAFCKHRGIDSDGFASNVRQGLGDALLRGVGTFWQDASGFPGRRPSLRKSAASSAPLKYFCGAGRLEATNPAVLARGTLSRLRDRSAIAARIDQRLASILPA